MIIFLFGFSFYLLKRFKFLFLTTGTFFFGLGFLTFGLGGSPAHFWSIKIQQQKGTKIQRRIIMKILIPPNPAVSSNLY